MTSTTTLYFTNSNDNNNLFGSLSLIPENIIKILKTKCKYVSEFTRKIYTYRLLNLIIQDENRIVKTVEEKNLEQKNDVIIQTKIEYDEELITFPIYDTNNYHKVSTQNIIEYSINNIKIYLIEEKDKNTTQYIEIISDNKDVINLLVQ